MSEQQRIKHVKITIEYDVEPVTEAVPDRETDIADEKQKEDWLRDQMWADQRRGLQIIPKTALSAKVLDSIRREQESMR